MGLNNFTTATGVAEFTDVDLDSVSLPSGYEISEDAGDLVVRDTNGTVALRRVDGGNWSFETNTVEAGQVGTASSPVDVEAAQVNANNVNAGEFGITNAVLSQSGKTRVASVELTSNQTINETVSFNSVNIKAGYLVDIQGILDGAGGDLQMTVDNAGSGQYDFLTRQGPTFTQFDNEDQFTVMESSSSGFRLMYLLSEPRFRPQISLLSGSSALSNGIRRDMLIEGEVDGLSADPVSLTFTNATVDEFRLDVIALGK